MVLELYNKDLFEYIKSERFDENRERKSFFYFFKLINGLHQLHSNCLCHLDIKLENLLLDEFGNLKITDFGFAASNDGEDGKSNFT